MSSNALKNSDELLQEIFTRDIENDSGFCFTAIIPEAAQGDTSGQPNVSSLELFEDDILLNGSHSAHDDIRRLGGGRYSHWKDTLYFSSSDNSSPLENGRRYVIRAQRREGYVPPKSVLRGHEVVPAFMGSTLDPTLVEEMERHPEAAGKSSWGSRNILQAFVLSMRPKVFLEVGAHIGSASVVIGSALKASGWGKLYCLEPQDHYFALLESFVKRGKLEEFVTPLKMLSTAPELKSIIGGSADMIFIDADHSYSAAFKDLEIADSLLVENGLIFLDDVGPEVSPALDPEGRGGVRQALLDFTENRPDLHVIYFEPPQWLNKCGMGMVCKQKIRPTAVPLARKGKAWLEKIFNR